MKNIIKFLCVFTLSVLLTGCLEVTTQVNLKPDGSGTVEETVTMSKQVIEMIKEFASSFSEDSAETEEIDIFKEEEIKKNADKMGEGVSFVSMSKLDNERSEGYKAIYSFNDIGKLRINQNPNSKIPLEEEEGMLEEEVQEEDVSFSFVKGDPSVLSIKFKEPEDVGDEAEEEEEEEVLQDSVNLDELEKLKAFLQDMKIEMLLNIEGEITETNATHTDNSKITLFKIDFNELINNTEKLEEFVKVNPQTLEEVKSIVRNLPGIKIEMNDPVYVKFK